MTRQRRNWISLRRAPLVALLGICSLITRGALADEDDGDYPTAPASDASQESAVDLTDVEEATTSEQAPAAAQAPLVAQAPAAAQTPWVAQAPAAATQVVPASLTAPATSLAQLRTSWADGLPSTLTYYADQPTPDGYYLTSRPRYGLIGAGAGILGGTWLVSMGTAIYLDSEPDGSNDPNFDDNYWPLFIPVAGPFVAIGTADSSGTGAAILALDGVVQMGSLAMIIAGFVSPKTELVRKEWHFEVTPVMSDSFAGVGVSGSM